MEKDHDDRYIGQCLTVEMELIQNTLHGDFPGKSEHFDDAQARHSQDPDKAQVFNVL